MSLPIVQVRDIPPEGMHIERPLDAPWLGHVLHGTEFRAVPGAAGDVAVDVSATGRDVFLRGSFRTCVEAQCVRCLEPAQVEVAGEFALSLHPATPVAPSAHPKRGEKDLTTDQLDQDVYTDGAVDVGQWVREQILLELPAHPACAQGCKNALAAEKPADPGPDVDPRLAPLRSIKLSTKKNKKENRRGRSQA